MGEPLVTIEVSVTGYGTATFTHVSANAAFVSAWHSFQSACDCTFKDFMKRAARKRVPNPKGAGDPIRVLGRNAWRVDNDPHSPCFVYCGDKVIMRAHHTDVEPGHNTEEGGE